MVLKKEIRGLKGMSFEKIVRLVQFIYRKWLKLEISTSFDFVLKKMKEKSEVLTSFYCKIV